MLTLSLAPELIHVMALEAAYEAGRNPSVSPADIYPAVQKVLEAHLGGDELSSSSSEACAIFEALHDARVALDNCVQVMTNDLGGLRLIQPELLCSQQALSKIEAVINQLQPLLSSPTVVAGTAISTQQEAH